MTLKELKNYIKIRDKLADKIKMLNNTLKHMNNTIIVEQILDKYSKQWRKDWKTYEKTQENS